MRNRKAVPSGRPRLFSDEIANRICDRIANGESLNRICEDSALPSRETVRRWLRDLPDFCGKYARAREDQVEHFLDQVVEIADAAGQAPRPLGESKAESGGDTKPAVDQLNLARLRIDARKWAAARLAPRRYGDRIAAEHSYPEGLPVQRVQAWDASKIDPAQAAEIYMRYMDSAV